MLEEAEAAAPLYGEGAAVTGAVPSGTRRRQQRMPQASLFGAVGALSFPFCGGGVGRLSTTSLHVVMRACQTENVLESMHEAFARGVKGVGGSGGAISATREQPTAMPGEEAGATMGTKPPGGVVVQEEVSRDGWVQPSLGLASSHCLPTLPQLTIETEGEAGGVVHEVSCR